MPNDLRLKTRWNKSRRARADGHQILYENNFSIYKYKQRGHNGGRRPAVNIPSVRDINRAANRQRVQNNAEAVARKREAKRILSQKCVDVLERAWTQPTLSGRFGCVYKPGDKEKTVGYTSLIHTRTHHSHTSLTYSHVPCARHVTVMLPSCTRHVTVMRPSFTSLNGKYCIFLTVWLLSWHTSGYV